MAKILLIQHHDILHVDLWDNFTCEGRLQETEQFTCISLFHKTKQESLLSRNVIIWWDENKMLSLWSLPQEKNN